MSRNTFSFSPLRSTHTITAPPCFGTTTILAHHGVASATLEMTPAFSMRSSSSLTFALIGMGTFCGVNRPCGWAPSNNLMEYSSPRFPRPLKRDGYCASQSCCSVLLVASILVTSLSVVIAVRPSKLVRSPRMTYWLIYLLVLAQESSSELPEDFIDCPVGLCRILVGFEELSLDTAFPTSLELRKEDFPLNCLTETGGHRHPLQDGHRY